MPDLALRRRAEKATLATPKLRAWPTTTWRDAAPHRGHRHVGARRRRVRQPSPSSRLGPARRRGGIPTGKRVGPLARQCHRPDPSLAFSKIATLMDDAKIEVLALCDFPRRPLGAARWWRMRLEVDQRAGVGGPWVTRLCSLRADGWVPCWRRGAGAAVWNGDVPVH